MIQQLVNTVSMVAGMTALMTTTGKLKQLRKSGGSMNAMLLKIERRDVLKIARRHDILENMDRVKVDKEKRWHLTDSIDLVKSRIGGNTRTGRYWYYLSGTDLDLFAFLLANNIRLANTYRVPVDMSGESRVLLDDLLRTCASRYPDLKPMINTTMKRIGLGGTDD